MARITRVSTEPSPTPASNTRTAGGRGWMMRELFGDAVRDLPFLAAGVDEQQIFLPVVEEAEIALRIAVCGRRCGRQRRRRRGAGRRAFDDRRAAALRRMRRHEAVDAVERVGGDAAAVAQPRRELAVIDGAPAEGRFRQPGLPAIVGDFLQAVVVRSWEGAARFGFLDEGARGTRGLLGVLVAPVLA